MKTIRKDEKYFSVTELMRLIRYVAPEQGEKEVKAKLYHWMNGPEKKRFKVVQNDGSQFM